MSEYYSQGDEEKYIVEYFDSVGIKNGRLLEIGAFHPEVFSNSRRLILNGWSGVLVEASPECYKNIVEFYKENNKVDVANYAITTIDGEVEFYNSEGAVATLKKQHYDIWKNIQLDYRKIKVPAITWNTFYKHFTNKVFDFISIDVEGADWDVISQIDLNETETKLVCIEYIYNRNEIANYLNSFGFHTIFINESNIIAGK
jgi:FkbM family methyltransferase